MGRLENGSLARGSHEVKLSQVAVDAYWTGKLTDKGNDFSPYPEEGPPVNYQIQVE